MGGEGNGSGIEILRREAGEGLSDKMTLNKDLKGVRGQAIWIMREEHPN